MLSSELISANDIRFEIFRNDYELNVKTQYALLRDIEYMISFQIEWILEYGEYKIALHEKINEYKKEILNFIDSIDKEYIKNITPNNKILNRYFSLQDYIQMAPTIIHVKETTHQNFLDVAKLFFTATTDLNIFYITNSIKNIEVENEWEERLKSELEKETFETLFHIIENIMKFKRPNESIAQAYKMFVEINKTKYNLFLEDLKKMTTSQSTDMTALTVVVNSLKKIAYEKD